MPTDDAWQEAVKSVSPYVVKISTPDSWGTGFVIFRSSTSPLCGIATAAHVVEHADEWSELIRIHNFKSDNDTVLSPNDRIILLDKNHDTAIIAFNTIPDDAPLPAQNLMIWENNAYVRIGNEVGWLGFPSIFPENMCFFSGRISCYLHKNRAYLIDGVSIHGSSGGPAFFTIGKKLLPSESHVGIIGVVTAYSSNRSTGETLPGLAMVSDISRLSAWVEQFHDLDEAKKAEPPSSESLSS